MRRFIALVVLVTAFPTIGLAAANRSGRIQGVGRSLIQSPLPKPHPTPTVTPFLDASTTKSFFEGDTYKRVVKKIDDNSMPVIGSAAWAAYVSTNSPKEKLTEKFALVVWTESHADDLAKWVKKTPKSGRAAFFAGGVAGTVATSYQYLTEDEDPAHKYKIFGGVFLVAFIFYLVVSNRD